MAALGTFIEKEGLTQAGAAIRLQVKQPRVSDPRSSVAMSSWFELFAIDSGATVTK